MKNKEYSSVKIETTDWQVMKDVRKLTGVPTSKQIQKFLKEKYPNMYKESK